MSREDFYQRFARFIVSTNAVKFGDFTLKSGMKSNVFFNFGEIFRGSELFELGSFFADFIVENSLHEVDVIFGPAYKGINIAIATSIALFQKHQISLPFAYNRKMEKQHAEGGKFVGADLSQAKSMIVVDDVITDGGTKIETIHSLAKFPDLLIKAFIVGIDREEVDAQGINCKEKFESQTGLKLYSLATKSKILKLKINGHLT